MSFNMADYHQVMVILCGLFYSVLCVFSLVTGFIYMTGRRQLNPLELSDQFVKKLKEHDQMAQFAKKMGFVTFVVGIAQGITAFSFFKGHSPRLYAFALGFTLFSIASVLFKLKGKINAFPLMKLCFYLVILVVLLLTSTRRLYF